MRGLGAVILRPFGIFARSVRARLLAIALLPVLVLLPLFIGVIVLRWSDRLDELLIVKVNSDLTIADQYLGRLLENAAERLDALGTSTEFATAIARDPSAQGFLAERREALGFDFLFLARPGGISRFDAILPADDWPVIAAALEGRAMSAVDLFDADTLEALSPDLAARAAIPLVPTAAARPTNRVQEDRGMMVHAAAPVTLAGGGRAALVGGVLLNRNLGFIDTINDLVYRERSLPEGSRGTATLFLGDVRVSTNVRLFENVRALGTRVSAAVSDRVLGANETWLDRAFVVNDWYVSAYEPILDSHGEAVGMLYVGFLEAPFSAARANSLLAVALSLLAVLAITVPVFLRWAGRIFLPLERMTQTMARVEAGDLRARIDARGPDEIGQVAGHLDTLLDQVQERDAKLRDWAAELERKVEDRTRDLREANDRLEQATRQLVLSEKLAAVGEITASVAHEINNPVAVIQGNLDVARDSLDANAAAAVKTEFDLIDAQVHRISAMVSKLLQFARPDDYAASAPALDTSEAIREALELARHQAETHALDISTDLVARARVAMDRGELTQVVINLVVNAAHAMPQGGALRIATRDVQADAQAGAGDGAEVEIEIADDGPGMPPEVLARIFDPFFTTKRSLGTGLGLSISQTLVTHAGGTILAQSTPGAGSRFTIRLPAAEPAGGPV